MSNIINPIKEFQEVLDFDTKADYGNIFNMERFSYKNGIEFFVGTELKYTKIDFSKLKPLTKPLKEGEVVYYKHHKRDEMVLMHYTNYTVTKERKEKNPLLAQILLNSVKFPSLGKTFYNYRLFTKEN